MQDRRKIGGISKDAYLHIVRQSGGNEAIASLDFDMRQSIISKIELMEKRFIKKATIGEKSLPISRVSLFSIFGAVCFLIGYGYLNPDKLPTWIRLILPFI
jgi:hypothetical protein